MSTPYETTKDALLDAALSHVAFDGWSEATLVAAASDAGVDMTLARAVCPRGAVDLAIAYHARGDRMMAAGMQLGQMPERYRDKIAAAVRLRIEAVSDKEAVRRGTTLFALPNYVTDGAKAVWGTADLI